MSKRWRIHPHDPARIAALQHAAGNSGGGGRVADLPRRDRSGRGAGFSRSEALGLARSGTVARLPPRPPARIHAALAAGRRIVVYGDYDVDGMTGTAILWLCLKLLGAEVSYYVPHRVDEGYGLNCEAIRTLAADKAEMLVTVDCGIGSVDEAVRGARIGRRTDRHRPSRAAAAVARGRRHRASATARRRLSVRRTERLGRGLETGLGVCASRPAGPSALRRG